MTSEKFKSDVISAVTTIIASQISNTLAVISQTQIVNNTNVGGNVNVSGNIFIQGSLTTQKAISSTISSAETEQNVKSAFGKIFRQYASDSFGLAQYADAENTAKIFLDSASGILSHVQTNCMPTIAQIQQINVENTGGNVDIKTQIFKQFASIVSDCTTSAVNKSTSIQTVSQYIEQFVSANSTGFNMLAVIVIGIVIVITIIIVAGFVISGTLSLLIARGLFSINSTIKLIINLIIIAIKVGIFVISFISVLTGIYLMHKYEIAEPDKTVLKYYLLSPGIKCERTILTHKFNITIADANKFCIDTDDCNGFDFTKEKTIFYSNLECSSIETVDPNSQITSGFKIKTTTKSDLAKSNNIGKILIIIGAIVNLISIIFIFKKIK